MLVYMDNFVRYVDKVRLYQIYDSKDGTIEDVSGDSIRDAIRVLGSGAIKGLDVKKDGTILVVNFTYEVVKRDERFTLFKRVSDGYRAESELFIIDNLSDFVGSILPVKYTKHESRLFLNTHADIKSDGNIAVIYLTESYMDKHYYGEDREEYFIRDGLYFIESKNNVIVSKKIKGQSDFIIGRLYEGLDGDLNKIDLKSLKGKV